MSTWKITFHLAPFQYNRQPVVLRGDYLHDEVFPPFIIASAVAHGRNSNEVRGTKHRGMKGRTGVGGRYCRTTTIDVAAVSSASSFLHPWNLVKRCWYSTSSLGTVQQLTVVVAPLLTLEPRCRQLSPIRLWLR